MTITITDFKTHCLRILREVEQTSEPVEISKQGKIRFRIVPVSAPNQPPWERLRRHGVLTMDPGESVLSHDDFEACR